MVFQNRKDFAFTSLVDPNSSDHVFMRNEYAFGVDGRCNVGYGLWQTAFASKAALTMDNVMAARAAMMAYKGTLVVAFVRVEHDAFRLCRRAVSGGRSLMAVPPEAMPDHDLDDEARDLRVKDYAEHCSIPFSI